MSSVIKTITPFLNKELLLQALNQIDCIHTVQGNEIIVSGANYSFNQVNGRFFWSNGRFNFQYGLAYSAYRYRDVDFKELKVMSSFWGTLEQAYDELYRRKLEELEKQRLAAAVESERKRLEEERLRLEKERQEYVEKQKTTIIAKAKEKGYTIREENAKGKIKLVLVRNTY
ncbi:hypothetical protein FACS1894172_04300 [Spirochaetia bacterium]|nr:hypothetical protein FACS1894172_04300 [Spirochaetia bacterium]